MYDQVIYNLQVSEFDIQALKRIRDYFGENDKTQLEHLAFDVLNRILEQLQ